MRTPITLVLVGIALYGIGFVLGSNDIDPASAIIATPGAGLAVVGLVWCVVVALRSRSAASR
jgi:hypothetical protein